MNELRKVSVLLAVYNGEDYITEAIESLLTQTYVIWELIIVDNGSTDQTIDICKRIAGTDHRVAVYSLPKKGKNRAYNYAFEKSQGDLICFFAADDILAPNSLQERVKGIYESENSFSTCCLKTFSDDPAHHGIVFPRDMTQPNYSGGSIMFTRVLAEKIFPLPAEQPNEDTWTSLHLRAFGTNHHIPLALYLYRIHTNNSYGYGLSFEEKREKYLHRMHAFQLFYDRYKNSSFPLLEQEIKPFLKGLESAVKRRTLPILFVNKLSLRNKLVLIFYCSPILYNIRYKYFKYLSGLLN